MTVRELLEVIEKGKELYPELLDYKIVMNYGFDMDYDCTAFVDAQSGDLVIGLT